MAFVHDESSSTEIRSSLRPHESCPNKLITNPWEVDCMILVHKSITSQLLSLNNESQFGQPKCFYRFCVMNATCYHIMGNQWRRHVFVSSSLFSRLHVPHIVIFRLNWVLHQSPTQHQNVSFCGMIFCHKFWRW